MTREEMFDIWAPAGGLWSPWVKPVLFASLPARVDASFSSQSTWPAVDVPWAPPAGERTALVLDLPGDEAVRIGIALAMTGGWRPVPLYNAHPGPIRGIGAALPLVDVRPIVDALVAGTETLRAAPLSGASPPAFLLDAHRRTGEGAALPGRFDNRSVSFATDFPSANLLLARGIARALLVQHGGPAAQPDLAHTLRRWNAAGVTVEAVSLDSPATPLPCPLAPPSRLALWWHNLTAAIGLRRHPLGGFGASIPEPSAG